MIAHTTVHIIEKKGGFYYISYLEMVPTETSASSRDDSLKLRQMKIVTHTFC